jgi:hypothetical protein
VEKVVTVGECTICELEQVLKGRSRDVRDLLRTMNPITDPRYAVLFADLVAIDGDLRVLRGQVRR